MQQNLQRIGPKIPNGAQQWGTYAKIQAAAAHGAQDRIDPQLPVIPAQHKQKDACPRQGAV